MANRLWFFLCIATLRGQILPSGCAMDRAIQLHQSGDWDAAIREYRACVAAQPNRAEVRSNLGAVLAKAGRYQEAIEQYRAALGVAAPAIIPSLRFNLALAFYKSFQIPEAASELEALHNAQPSDFKVALLLADCRLRTGAFRQVIEILTPLEELRARHDLDTQSLAASYGIPLHAANRLVTEIGKPAAGGVISIFKK